MKAVLSRNYRNTCTTGRLVVFDGDQRLFDCFTLELPWNGNQRRVSCIPEGTYQATKIYSPKNGNCFLLHDVPNRDAIEVHKGNYTKDTEGCIMPGTYLIDLDDDGTMDVAESTKAMNRLLEILPSEFEIYVI